MEFREKLKRIMDAQHTNANRIAKAMGISATAVGNWLNGKTYPQQLSMEKLAFVLGVSAADLADDQLVDNKQVDDERERREYIQMVKDSPEYRMMFDLAEDATMDQIKATVAFLKTIKDQGIGGNEDT